MPVRVLHLADLHLDSAYGGRSATRIRLRAHGVEALSNAVRFAIDERLDAVVIAGDAFDEGRLGFDTRAAFRGEMLRLSRAGVTVIYVTGNHDPGAAGSTAAGLGLGEAAAGIRHAAPIHEVTGSDPKTLAVGREGETRLWIVAAGHGHPQVTDNLASQFQRPPEDGVPAMAVLHTQVSSARGASGHQPYAPSDPATLRSSGFDYWALGHVHLRGRATPDAPAWYPGNLMGRSPRETGPKGGLLVELDGDGLVREPRFVPFARVEFAAIDLSDADQVPLVSAEGIARRAHELWPRLVAERDGAAMPHQFVLRLTGAALHLPLAHGIQTLSARTALEDAVAAELGLVLGDVDLLEVQLRLDALVPAAERDEVVDEIERSPSALREALRLVREIAADPRRAELMGFEGALLPGLDGEARAAFLARWTEGLEEELIARVMGHSAP